MAKIRPDYENSLFARFLHWLTDGSSRLDDAMTHALDDQAAMTRSEANQLAHEHENLLDARRAALAEREKAMYAHVHSWASSQGKGISNWIYRIAAVLICVIELVQLVTALGSCDVDDLILNLPGILLGWVIHKLTEKTKK